MHDACIVGAVRSPLASHARAIRAIDEGRFDREITPVAGVSTDEGPRRDSTQEKMAALTPLRPDWELTAATASQISDGAAAVLVASPGAVRRHGFTPPRDGSHRRRALADQAACGLAALAAAAASASFSAWCSALIRPPRCL